MVILDLITGSFEKSMEFQVIVIPTPSNLLLRRLWIHGLDGITSSLHRKVKFITDENKVIKLYGDSWIQAIESSRNAPILEVQLPEHGGDKHARF